MVIHEITPSSRLDTQRIESTNQNSKKSHSPELLNQRIRKSYSKTFGTSLKKNIVLSLTDKKSVIKEFIKIALNLCFNYLSHSPFFKIMSNIMLFILTSMENCL